VSDEGDAADDAASDGGDTEDNRGSGGRTALVTKPSTPQRPTGKRTRQRVVEADEDVDGQDSSEAEESKKDDSKSKKAAKTSKSKAAEKAKKAKKADKTGPSRARTANPIVFVYNYLKQVVAEMRKVIWPNRKQMLTYTSVVLAFLAFMVALVGGTDLGLSKLVLLVFG
jgi:preprotein translocase subunit SecE